MLKENIFPFYGVKRIALFEKNNVKVLHEDGRYVIFKPSEDYTEFKATGNIPLYLRSKETVKMLRDFYPNKEFHYPKEKIKKEVNELNNNKKCKTKKIEPELASTNGKEMDILEA